MRARFICPHCRVAVDPAAMEESRGDSAEFRVCPFCDSPVVLAVRHGQPPQGDVAAAGSARPISGGGEAALAARRQAA